MASSCVDPTRAVGTSSCVVPSSILNILLLPEIVNIIDKYLDDNDKICLLSMNKSSMTLCGFVINKIHSISTIYKFWLFHSKTKIGLNIHSWYDNIPINDNVFFVKPAPQVAVEKIVPIPWLILKECLSYSS